MARVVTKAASEYPNFDETTKSVFIDMLLFDGQAISQDADNDVGDIAMLNNHRLSQTFDGLH
jgi:hypothetical protein